MIKNYIFDFGNVLGNFYPDWLTAPFVQDEALLRTISDVVFDRALWDPLDAGRITDEALKAEICHKLPDSCRRGTGGVRAWEPQPWACEAC